MVYGAIDTGAKYGMIPMDKALANLVREGLIKTEDALTRAHNPEAFRALAGLGAAKAPAPAA
jgi:Tfp pilus assembly pilus retraction ATPase PilT